MPNLPANQRTWTCPVCSQTYDYTDSPTVGFFAQLWHGKDNVRESDGSKPRGFFSWS
jgi:hypothetical protein